MTEVSDRIDVIVLGNGRAFPWPIYQGSTTDEPFQAAAAAIQARALRDAVISWDQAFRTASADASLSERGKQDRIDAAHSKAAAQWRASQEGLIEVSERLNGRVAQILSPPVIDRADVAAVMRDHEIRAAIRGQKDPARFLPLLEQSPEVLEAVMRSPVPFGSVIDQAAQGLWRDHVARTRPEFGRLETDTAAAIEWARGAVGSAQVALGLNAHQMAAE